MKTFPERTSWREKAHPEHRWYHSNRLRAWTKCQRNVTFPLLSASWSTEMWRSSLMFLLPGWSWSLSVNNMPFHPSVASNPARNAPSCSDFPMEELPEAIHTPGPSLLSSSLTYHLCYPFCPHFLLSLLFSLEHVAFSPCRQLCDNVSTKPYCGSSKFCGRSNQFQGRKDACFGQIRTTPFCLAIKGMLWSLFFPLVLGSSQRCCWSLGRRKQCSMPAPLQS